MEEDRGYGETSLPQSLQQFWDGFNHKFDPIRSDLVGKETSPALWQHFINLEKESIDEDEENACYGYAEKLLVSRDETSEPDDHCREIERRYSLPDDIIVRVGAVCIADGAAIGDIPAIYTVQGLRSYELPVIGTFVHPKITPGFCYVVRPADSNKGLFMGKGLCLQSIGMGYGKRITFEGNSLNKNDNYFWSDTNQQGYGFSLQLIHKKDKFTLKDANGCSVATVEVENILGPQVEIEHTFKDNKIEKEAKVYLRCSIHYFEESFPSHETVTISGTAVASKDPKSRKPANVIRVKKCKLNGEKGYTLVSVQESFKRDRIISGDKHNDVPTTYTVTGLMDHELPVIGTFVDPRIAPGFKYKVRPLNGKKYLFGETALTLLSIGRGYGKRLTFAGESLNANENYFWSDTNPEGYGFTLEAVSEGETFRIEDSGGLLVGTAKVYRTGLPQKEIMSTVVGNVYTKTVRVSISCHLSVYGEPDLTNVVTGVATVERRGRIAKICRIEDIAVGSQINDLFVKGGNSLVFVRV